MRIIKYLFGWRKWNIKKGDLVLELGSGGSPMARSNILVEKFIDDDSERELSIIKDRPLICADIINLPFKDKVIDFVYTSHVVEHLDDLETGLREIARVGKRGLNVMPGEIFERNYDKNTHKWIISKKDNELVFREKCDCTRLNHDDLLWEWKKRFWKIYTRKRNLLEIRSFWEDKIPFNIVKCRKSNSIKRESGNTQRKLKREIGFKTRVNVKVKIWLSRFIRIIYS